MSIKWIAGIAGTWFLLSALSEVPALATFATALAVVIAGSATMIYGVPALRKLGF